MAILHGLLVRSVFLLAEEGLRECLFLGGFCILILFNLYNSMLDGLVVRTDGFEIFCFCLIC